MEALQGKLGELYLRTGKANRFDYAETSLIAEIVRGRDWETEFEEIRGYRDRLPAVDRRFFPNSLYKLLVGWQEILDRARTYEPTHTQESQGSKMVRKLMADLEV